VGRAGATELWAQGGGRGPWRPVTALSSGAVLLRVLAQFGYLAIAALLLAGGLGVPVPEELVQLTAGYLAQRGVLDFLPALAVTYAGIVGGDFLLFLAARRHGDRLLARPGVARLLTAARRARLEAHFARHAFLTVMVARHLSGFRVPAFILAATHQVRPRIFLAADALSSLLSVPLVVSLGYLFAERLAVVRRRVHQAELVLALALALCMALYYGLILRRRRGPPPGGAAGERQMPEEP